MNKFMPHISPVYPKNNELIFEEWFAQNYKGCNTDRELLPVFFTSFYVNNNYGNDLEIRKELQDFIFSIDKNKKWFVPIQYDDSILEDVSGLDLLRFEMSKKGGIDIPLICQPHPYKFNGEKKYFASFVGSKTHPCRNGLERYINKQDWYISYEPHENERYCDILSKSIFAICPRGYGFSSFRTCEAMQYGAIPVYLSDTFIDVFDLDFDSFGIKHLSEDITTLALKLATLSAIEIATKQNKVREVYEKYYTYSGCYDRIIEYLEKEYLSRTKNI